MEPRIHLKGLNGIRAISAIVIVIGHASTPGYIVPIGFGEYAVTFFFALSGFLITYLLFAEKNRTGISIKNFYIRRILRIWPLYFLYLTLAIITIFIYNPGKLPGSLPWYIFFAANVPIILQTQLPYIFHYWTLGTEEEFYLFWPWIMKSAKNVLRALIIFTVTILLIKLVCRFIYYRWDNITPLFITTTVRFECMSIGGIAAILCLQQHRTFLKIATHRITEIVCWACVALMFAKKFHITPMFNHDLATLVAIGLMVNFCFNPRPLISLENRVLDWLGKISYGIYVFHPLVIFYVEMILDQLTTSIRTKAISLYPAAVVITITIAWLSYTFFEKKFLREKERFTTVKNNANEFS